MALVVSSNDDANQISGRVRTPTARVPFESEWSRLLKTLIVYLNIDIGEIGYLGLEILQKCIWRPNPVTPVLRLNYDHQILVAGVSLSDEAPTNIRAL